MPGARPRIKPLSASESSGTSLDEVSQLELHLQRQLEEDVARIFDESIYSDLEVVCGKLKILTHSCILKARTHNFFHKLEAILHVNIGRNTFDEIYSFISDAYTECDIQHQENEIINYLNVTLKEKPAAGDNRNKQEDLDESETYATPTCVSPEDSFQKTLSSSPSTELTKEYYALVPIEGQILDKELIEQDELSTAFQSFIHLRAQQLNDKNTQCIKPTTLSLNSSHISKINKHSIICDISKDLKNPDSCLFENDKNKINNATSQVRKHIKSTQLALRKSHSCETSAGAAESGYSPDSLWVEEASSSSDYLSAAHSATPLDPHVSAPPVSPPDNRSKMNNTASDSGFDNNAMLESINSHKDVTLADVSLTESSFHDLMNDDSAFDIEKKLPKTKLASQISTCRLPTTEMSGRSSKDEKQRQNEEIVILESSSLSSETGSWESVFPPKMPEKDLCEKFISIERQNSLEPAFKSRSIETTDMSFDIAQKSSNKTTCCFIDAASLADEEERHQVQVEPFPIESKMTSCRFSSRPLPCESKQVISPNDFSESNDNDDSLEQPDPDSIQKDISPTIFEMSLAPEDSVAGENNTSYEDIRASVDGNVDHGFVPHVPPIAVENSASNTVLKVSRQNPLKHLTLVEESHTSYDGFQISKQQNLMLHVSLTKEKNKSIEDLMVTHQQNSLSHVSLEEDNEMIQKQYNLMTHALPAVNNTSYGNLMSSNQQNSMNDRSVAEGRNTSHRNFNSSKQEILTSHVSLPDANNTSLENCMVSNQQNALRDVSIAEKRNASGDSKISKPQNLTSRIPLPDENNTSYEDLAIIPIADASGDFKIRKPKNFMSHIPLPDKNNTSYEDFEILPIAEERNASDGAFKIRKPQNLMSYISLPDANSTSSEDLTISRQQNSLPHTAVAGSSNDINISSKPNVERSYYKTSTPNNSIISLKTSSATFEVPPAASRPQSHAATWVVSLPDANSTSSEDLTISRQQNSLPHTAVAGSSNDINISSKPNVERSYYKTSTPNNSIISLKTSSATFEVPPAASRPQSHAATWVVSLPDANSTSSEDLTISRQQNSLPHTAVAGSSNDINISSKPNVERSYYKTSTPNNSIISLKTSSATFEVPPAASRPQSYAATWVVDMSKQDNAPSNRQNKPPGDKICETLRASSKSGSNSEGCKSRSSVDSDSSDKSTHKFYIDLSTLPDASAPKQNASETSEKKNIFSMFIDLGENSSTVKKMPARISSSLNSKKNCKTETKQATPKTVKSHKKSPGTVNGDDPFEKLESLCNSSQMTISEILQSSVAKTIVKESRDKDKRIAPTIREEPDTDQCCDVFVKLSDLDRTPVQNNDIVAVSATAECCERMTRSIPDNNWGQSSHASTRSIDIISSFHSENALSLNRLFPHLKNDISRSMPGSLSGRTRSPLRLGVSSSYGDRDELASDISEMSSVQSSMCRSVVENSTTEDTSHTSSLLANCQSRLGQDLLRMFVEEIAPDVVVEVSGRRIKAHKCILSSRFSYNVVHFALCHIYSGISAIPDSISIVELATIADMLSLEGLKEAIMFTLKAKYCHHFHEPCQVCTAGVLECFPLSSVYGLDDLYRRCLRWITRHFRKVWPTKAFATLPSELLDKCYQEHLLNLTTHNLIDTVQDCGLTVASLPRCRWAEVVARLCRRLMGAAAVFAGARLEDVVLAAAAPRAPPPPAAARALDACLASAVDCAAPDELCRALAALPDLPESLAALRRRCEGALIRAAPLAAAAPSFRDLPPDLRRRLRRCCDTAPAPAPTSPPSARKAPPPAALTRNIERVRTSFVPYAQRPPSESSRPRTRDSRHAPPRVRTTRAQEERAKFNMTKSSGDMPNGKSAKAHSSYKNAKPRYLEPRPAGAGSAGRAAGRKPLARLGSSSESSRNLSPVLAGGALRPRTADPSTDSLSDSLNANKYATYTKPSRQNANAPTAHPSKCDKVQNQSTKTRATKIPVYQNKTSLRRRELAPPAAAPVPKGAEATFQSRHRGSLMMATKSSSAKVVPKIVKEQTQTKSMKIGNKQRTRSPSLADIPAMERSGTFLKDEPTFGDKTTNIDIDE